MTRTACLPSPRIGIEDLASEGPAKERFVRRLFEAITPRYDLFNRFSSLGLDAGWRRRTVEHLALGLGDRLLDLASGTGDLALAALRQLAPMGQEVTPPPASSAEGGRLDEKGIQQAAPEGRQAGGGVTACDLSGSMLRTALRKAARHPLGRFHLRCAQGRAEALPFAQGVFEAATMGFALRNVSDLSRTLEELHRVLKPGGRIGLLEFGRPANPVLRLGHWLWLSFSVPVIGLVTTGCLWPFLYLRRSILRFMPPEEVIRHLEQAGFTRAASQPLTGGTVRLYTACRP